MYKVLAFLVKSSPVLLILVVIIGAGALYCLKEGVGPQTVVKVVLVGCVIAFVILVVLVGYYLFAWTQDYSVWSLWRSSRINRKSKPKTKPRRKR